MEGRRRAGGGQALRRANMGKTWEIYNQDPSSWRLPGQHALLNAGGGWYKPRERSSLMPVQRDLLGAPAATANAWGHLEQETGAHMSLLHVSGLGQARPRPNTIQEERHLEQRSGPGQDHKPDLASSRQTWPIEKELVEEGQNRDCKNMTTFTLTMGCHCSLFPVTPSFISPPPYLSSHPLLSLTSSPGTRA